MPVILVQPKCIKQILILYMLSSPACSERVRCSSMVQNCFFLRGLSLSILLLTLAYKSLKKLLLTFCGAGLLSMVLDISGQWCFCTDLVLRSLLICSSNFLMMILLLVISLDLVVSSLWREVTLFYLIRNDLEELSFKFLLERLLMDRIFFLRLIVGYKPRSRQGRAQAKRPCSWFSARMSGHPLSSHLSFQLGPARDATQHYQYYIIHNHHPSNNSINILTQLTHINGQILVVLFRKFAVLLADVPYNMWSQFEQAAKTNNFYCLYYYLSVMRTLSDFATPNNPANIFKDATHLPAFFQNNLVDPSRVVKHFSNDPQANIRVFYYQYLKLCFELQNIDFESYIRKIEEIINNQVFKFMFLQDDDPQIFNDLQFKQLIMEFFGVLGQGGVGIMEAVNYYPIIDTVFIYFFRVILILVGKTDSLDSYIEREEMFQFLCSYFNVQISTHEKCIKFVETDIFVYQQNPKDVYMAYMDVNFQQEQQEQPLYQSQEVIEPARDNNSKLEMVQSENVQPHSGHDSYQSHSQRGTSQNNKSYISSQFVDYTNINSSNLAALVKKDQLKTSGEIPNQHSFGNILQNYNDTLSVDKYSNHSNKQANKAPSSNSYQSNNYNNFNAYQSKSSISNSTPYNPYANYQSKLNKYDQPVSKPGSHTHETPFSKKTEQTPYIVNDWKAAPTKDPGFSKYNAAEVNYQAEVYDSKKYSEIDDKYGVKKPASYIPYEQKYEYKKPASSFNSSKPSSTLNEPSNANNPAASTYQYTNSYNQYSGSNWNTNINKPPSNVGSNPSVTSSKPVISQPIQPVPPPSKSTNSFLNVSLQFTNSFTMKIMAEPHKSNVKTIRNRARQHRNSLVSYIK